MDSNVQVLVGILNPATLQNNLVLTISVKILVFFVKICKKCLGLWIEERNDGEWKFVYSNHQYQNIVKVDVLWLKVDHKVVISFTGKPHHKVFLIL